MCVLFLFSVYVFSISDDLLANVVCSTGYYLNTLSYLCEQCSQSGYSVNQFQECVTDSSNTTCSGTNITIGNTCQEVSESDTAAITLYLSTVFSSANYSQDYTDLFNGNSSTNNVKAFGYYDKLYNQPKQLVANLQCISHMYDFNPFSILTSSSSLYHNYRFWLQSIVFMSYGQNINLETVKRESFITGSFTLNQTVNFYLGRYFYNGTFRSLELLTNEWNLCDDIIQTKYVWKRFGYNYYSSCLLNLNKYISTTSTDLFDLFIQDGTDSQGNPILRPVPVIDLLSSDNQNINTADQYYPVRRFFVYDNYSTTGMIQYADNIMIEFELGTSYNPFVPYLIINYSSVNTSLLTNSSDYITNRVSSEENPLVSFNALYVESISGLLQNSVTIIAVYVVLAFFLSLFCSYIYGRTNGEGGKTTKFMGTVISIFLSTIGTSLFLMVWAFSFYYWCFFKLQKSLHTTLPTEDELSFVKVLIWISFVLLLVGIIVRTYYHSDFGCILIDWETPHEEGLPVSAWRRVMISNELNRLLTVRSYNTGLSVIVMIFLLVGLKWELYSQPIPSLQKIDVGKSYPVLRVGLSGALFLIVIFVQYVFMNMIYWRFFGNPFYNFLDLCSNANISIMLMESSSHGYYVHGRYIHSHSDVTMGELSKNLEYEADNLVGDRGLIPNTQDQVFEFLLSSSFRQQFESISYNMNFYGQGMKTRAKEISPLMVKASLDMNEFLKVFYDQSRSSLKYSVQQKSALHQLVGYLPNIFEESALFIDKENAYKELLLNGIELKTAVFLAVTFIAIEIETESPSVAGFVCYVFDFILRYFFRVFARRNISRKSLLDDRFLM